MKAIKSRFRGVEGPCWGIQIRGGVRRNRLQKWRAASLNTGFSSIFDFGASQTKNILPTSF
jgi:hypothetical protein